MAKYDPLRDHLIRRRLPRIELSFREIEAKIGYMLPNGAAATSWCACEGKPGPREVHKIAWREAGYDAELLEEERVLFTRRSDDPSDP